MRDHHLVPLAPHVEDDGAFADLVGDDEEGGGRVDRPLRRVPAHVIVNNLLATSPFHPKDTGRLLRKFLPKDFSIC